MIFPPQQTKTKMKITPSKTTTQSTCLPPEAYMRLWKSVATETYAPKFKSSVYPNSNMKTIPFKK